MARFEDIFTHPTKYKQHGLRMYSVENDSQITGIVLATRGYSFDTFALNKPEFDRLLAAKRDGRIADAIVVGAVQKGGNNPFTYCGEMDAGQLETQLTGVEPRTGRFGAFYTLADCTFSNPPF
jgi:hypothetical protein